MTTTRGQFLLGKVIGSCVIEKLLGQGGSSAVCLARQSAPERSVAIKVFLPRTHMNAQMRKDFYDRFLLEAEAASRLDHPHIMPIYSYGEQDGLPYIIMPYMPRGTLSEYVVAHGPLSVSQAQWYLEQLASALDYAHQTHGYVHCDVKPANILLDEQGAAVLADFGIAHLIQPESIAGTGDPSPRASEMLLGTPDFISPEQALGQRLDGRSDIYSLGISLFFLLTARLPFRADSTIAVALLQVHEPPPPLGRLRADIPPQIDGVIQKALAKRAGERYQTAAEFSEAFTSAIASADVIYEPAVGDEVHGRSVERPQAGSDGARRLAPASWPGVRPQPTRPGSLGARRMLLTALLLLAVASAAALGGGLIVTRLTHVAPINAQGIISAGAAGDDLTDNENWPDGGTFFFTKGLYHIQNRLAHNVALALYVNHQYTNFRLSVTAVEQHGTGDGADYYGVAFRGSADQSHYYLFEVVAWGGGQYQFSRYDSDGRWDILAGGPAPGLLRGPGQSNTIALEASGSAFRFWINGARVRAPLRDTSARALNAGEIGLAVEEQGTEIVFSHLIVHALAA
jgi:tRNA A-37 threonylcarbamoyl transferase component Bud32